MLQSVDTIMCQVTDMERAVGFYRDVLGLTPVNHTPYWSDFELGRVRIGLHPTFASGYVAPAGGWILGFAVDDIAELKQELEAHGHLPGEFHDIPGGVVLEFRDPEGNSLQAVQHGITMESMASAASAGTD